MTAGDYDIPITQITKLVPPVFLTEAELEERYAAVEALNAPGAHAVPDWGQYLAGAVFIDIAEKHPDWTVAQARPYLTAALKAWLACCEALNDSVPNHHVTFSVTILVEVPTEHRERVYDFCEDTSDAIDELLRNSDSVPALGRVVDWDGNPIRVRPDGRLI